ncbi:MAG: hypothetical protein LBG18_05745 [Mediterranea sp.]|jgi:hypothetical protein|nr:hypothetical protein [Mediterranea sp.]
MVITASPRPSPKERGKDAEEASPKEREEENNKDEMKKNKYIQPHPTHLQPHPSPLPRRGRKTMRRRPSPSPLERAGVRLFGVRLLFLFLFFSCTRADVEFPGEIVACASVRGMNTVRGAYEGTLSANPLEALVVASLSEGDYGEPYCSGVMTFTGDAKPVGLGDYRYPGVATLVYLSGLYPADGWTGSGGERTFTLTGKDDVMFAPQVETRMLEVWNERYATLEFAHRLTLMKIWLYGDAEMVGRIRVRAIRLVRAMDAALQTELTVTLGGEQAVTFAAPEAEASPQASPTNGRRKSKEREKELPCYVIGTDEEYAGQEYAVTTALSGQAYVLAPPVTAGVAETKEYTFVVDYLDGATEKTQQVDVDLMRDGSASFDGSTEGHAFNVTVRFAAGGQVVIYSVLTGWIPGGEYEVRPS